MAVVNLKSTAITQADANAATNPYIAKGSLIEAVGSASLANGDSIASTYRLCRVPSNARISSVRLFCTAITSGAADIGLRRTAADGGAVVDADYFIAAQSIAAALAGTEVSGGNVITPVNREKRLWELVAGLTADPNTYYDVTVTLTAATTAAGTLAVQVSFTV
jgi:hypothetical protein